MDDLKNGKKPSVKSERVRAYFIEAAKQIITCEGVENVSVRKVADLAGYSYATIYNYFSDLNALLQQAKQSMIMDLLTYMGGVQGNEITGINDVKKLGRTYVGYYLEHPHVFRFFYSYRLTDEPSEPVQFFDYASSWQNTYQSLVADGTIRAEDVGIVAKTIIYALHGLLALYFSDNGLTQEAMLSDLDQLTDYLLKRRSHV